MAQSITEVVSPSNTQTQVHSWQAISISNGKFVAQLPADVRPTFLDFQKHHRTDEVVKAVNDFFLEHWPFKTSKHRQRFVNEGLPCYVCALYPLSLDERLQWDCRLLTLGFLIDDLLDGMSLEEGKAFNSKIVKCARGMTHPDRVVPAQWIRYDTFNEMRALDKPLADDVLQYVVGWLLAQDGKKFMPMDSKEYFHFRDADFGRGLLASIMRFCADLHLSDAELELLKPIEQNVLKHMTVVNDICSFDKEVLAAKDAFELGAICSSVPIVMELTGLDEVETKRVMWQIA